MANNINSIPVPFIRVSIVEQHNVARDSLAAIIDSSYGFQTIGIYRNLGWHAGKSGKRKATCYSCQYFR